jgi:Fe-S oxidoreductase
VLVACPNCNRIFSDYGDGLTVQTVYELLAEMPASGSELFTTEAVFHDPCVARCNTAAQDAARKMVRRAGVRVAEMKHSREKTLCCGRGGGVNFVRPDTLEESIDSRVAEAAGRPIVTYCAACAGTYRQKAVSLHLLDLWMSPKKALAGKVKASVAPFTYLNRLLLKRKLRKSGLFKIMRDRKGEIGGSRQLQTVAVFLLLFTAAVILRYL